MPNHLPDGAEKYKETREFTQDTVPRGLLAQHSTKAGTWGNLLVLEGALEVTRIGQQPFQVQPGDRVVFEPQEPHFVTCAQPVRFKVEFYRLP